MAAFFLLRYDVISSDSLLAWPITDSIAHPDRYSPEDLLVQAGASGNFLLYQWLAWLPVLRGNYPLRDFLVYLPIFFLLLVAWWTVFLRLGGSRAIATFATIVLVWSDDKLALNWAHVAPQYFISSSSVQFLQVFGLLWFLEHRRALALVITALTGYIHPATALSFLTIYAVILLHEALETKAWRPLGPVFLAGAIFLPNALMIALNSQGAFTATREYFETFERYQPQAYLGDHFRMGYACTLAAILFVYRYLPDGAVETRYRRELILFIGAGLGMSVLWFLNLYLTKNLQIIHTFFVMRAFTLIKPLLIFLIVIAAVHLYASSNSPLEQAGSVLLMLVPLEFSPSIALVIVVCCAAYAAGPRWWLLLAGMLIAAWWLVVAHTYEVPLTRVFEYARNFGSGRAGNELNWFQIVVFFVFIALILRVRAQQNSPTRPRTLPAALSIALAAYMVVVVLPPTYGRARHAMRVHTIFNFDPEDYWGVRRGDPAYADLLDWARRSPAKLFAVSPYNDRFLSFRYLSGKGVYVFHRDIAQLMYSPSYYVTAVNRLVEIGGSSPELPKAFMTGETPRSNGDYEKKCRELIAKGQFDAIIFEKKRLPSDACLNTSPVFENVQYIVFRTTRGTAPSGS